MADISLESTQPRTFPHVPASRVRARIRLFRRQLRRDMFCFGQDDRMLADIGRSRADRYDWLSALMRR